MEFQKELKDFNKIARCKEDIDRNINELKDSLSYYFFLKKYEFIFLLKTMSNNSSDTPIPTPCKEKIDGKLCFKFTLSDKDIFIYNYYYQKWYFCSLVYPKEKPVLIEDESYNAFLNKISTQVFGLKYCLPKIIFNDFLINNQRLSRADGLTFSQ